MKATKTNEIEEMRAQIADILATRTTQAEKYKAKVEEASSRAAEAKAAAEAAEAADDAEKFREQRRAETEALDEAKFYRRRLEEYTTGEKISKEDSDAAEGKILQYINEKEEEVIEAIRPHLAEIFRELAAFRATLTDANHTLLSWHGEIREHKPAVGYLPAEPARCNNPDLLHLLHILNTDYVIKTHFEEMVVEEEQTARPWWAH